MYPSGNGEGSSMNVSFVADTNSDGNVVQPSAGRKRRFPPVLRVGS
jgi:hypothetical protein